MNNAYVAGAWLPRGYCCEVKVSRGRIYRHALNRVNPYKDKKKVSFTCDIFHRVFIGIFINLVNFEDNNDKFEKISLEVVILIQVLLYCLKTRNTLLEFILSAMYKKYLY